MYIKVEILKIEVGSDIICFVVLYYINYIIKRFNIGFL